MTIAVPPDVAESIRDFFAEEGERWLADLPELVTARCRDWDLELIGAPFGGGTHSFVAPVRRGDDSVAVLKVPFVDEENAGEPAGLHCYAGDGAIRLYDFDAGSGAMLVEWARPGDPLLRQPTPPLEGEPENAGKVLVAAELYRRLRREPGELPPGYPPPPSTAGLVAEWARWPEDPQIVAALPAPLLDQARRWCTELAVRDGPLLIVNRDTHLGNIVAAEREPWLVIDPKPYLGEAAFDAGFLILKQMQSAPDRADARQMVARTADALGVDRERARGWAFLRAMEQVVWAIEDEDERAVLERHLAVAFALSGTRRSAGPRAAW
ncbi:aminoglycoside phosphotransferase family protein [Nocardia cyriacigeorgica]|uniref:aminoglycoside phosphotransferase family protein n=1 Tax=Nocardia cyriacigeorgica TaxID=135487 RepID=UPI000CE9CADD|nr:aminoglycoside phosphotransferase family protein [Nocardia cyriacigeorgica]AVH22780.1 kinase [Nocardia cyriacigeorgica]MBF6325772.1 kinase [Nocardia cyriacigeorgica]MBF6498545.1 kinase [Nocardia cyriacigeorgica]PPJ03378.1 kinase [Nocardia cyriacigeorgica]